MEEIIYKTIEYRGYTIKIAYDTDPVNPREWDNVGTIYSNCRNYNPDGHTLDELYENDYYQDEEGNFDRKKFYEDCIWMKVYAYIHGGITIRCGGPYSCSWDSGMFGIIAVKKEKAMKEFGFKEIGEDEIKHVGNILREEIKELDHYYTGEVYGYEIYKDDVFVDSLFGYYGDESLDGLMGDAKNVVDNMIKEVRRKRIEYLRKNIKEKGRQLCLPMFVIEERRIYDI